MVMRRRRVVAAEWRRRSGWDVVAKVGWLGWRRGEQKEMNTERKRRRKKIDALLQSHSLSISKDTPQTPDSKYIV